MEYDFFNNFYNLKNERIDLTKVKQKNNLVKCNNRKNKKQTKE